jgi:hypothetical protein
MKTLRSTRDILAHALAAALLLALVAGPAAAQTRKKAQGPRAMGLLEWATPAGPPTLIPITLWINGQYQDASIYMADPVPMALDSGIVYEAYKAGVSQGLFEIRQPQKRLGNWIATGTWTSRAAEVAAEKREEKMKEEGMEGRPILRRRPESSASAAATASVGAPTPDVSASPGLENPPPDSGRPILKRGQPPAEAAPAVPAPSTSAASPAAARKRAAAPVMELVAISDATNTASSDWRFAFNEDEEKSWTAKMVQVAEREIAASEKAPTGAALPALSDYQFHAFDLDQDNEPVMVITGRVAPRAALPAARRRAAIPARPETYVTVVARLDIDNNIRRIFSSVTTSGRLDVVGRLQLIDAVDADGDGHAELLFRRIGQDRSSFQLFRAGADQLWKLFDSARE